MKKITHFALVLGLSLSMDAIAQTKPSNIIQLNDKIESVNVNNASGVAVVEGNNKVYGIVSSATTPLWSFNISEFIDNKVSLADIADNKFSNELTVNMIEGSKFVVLTKGLSKAIVNTVNGEILYSSKKNQVSPIDHQMVEGTPITIISYVKDKKVYACAINLNSGNILWNTEISEKAGLKDKIASFFNSKDKDTFTPSPIQDSQQNIYAFLGGKLIKFDNQGKIAWAVEKKGVSRFGINKEENSLVFLSASKGLGGFFIS